MKSEIANLKNRSSSTEFGTSARVSDDNLEAIRIDLDNIKRLDAQGKFRKIMYLISFLSNNNFFRFP